VRARLPVLGAARPAVDAERQHSEPPAWPATRIQLAAPVVCIASWVPDRAVAFASEVMAGVQGRGCHVVALYDEHFAGQAGTAALRALEGAQRIVLSPSALSAAALAPLQERSAARLVLGLGWPVMAHFEALLTVEVEAPRALVAGRRPSSRLAAAIDVRVAPGADAVARRLGDWLGERLSIGGATGAARTSSAALQIPNAHAEGG